MSEREIRLSVCLIVKNEEKFLQQCLDSVKPIADEIIILDTGSDDRTVEIATSSGARVFHYTWENDFAKARNQCLSYARGSWILVLDADEQLDTQSYEAIREEISRAIHRPNEFNVYSVKFINYLNSRNTHESIIHYYTRLFPNLKELRYTGKLHEQLTLSVPWITIHNNYTDEILIHHYGYSPEVAGSKDKDNRNKALLENALKEDPGNWFHHHNYATMLFDDGKYREALEHFHKAEMLAEKINKHDFDTSFFNYQAKIYLNLGQSE